RSDIPAVTHVDYSARIQTVHQETNPIYHALLRRFEARTGCAVLVNTSFNVRGEPIVCTPEDAFRCFMSTEMAALALGNCFLKKEDQPKELPFSQAMFDPCARSSINPASKPSLTPKSAVHSVAAPFFRH